GKNVRQVSQLRGRAGRQGQAGSSADIPSLDDELIRLYGGRERIEKIMDRLGVDTIDMAALARDHPQYARVINGIVNKNRQTIRDRGFDQRSNLVKFEEATSPYLGLFDQYKVNMESALNEDFDLLTDKAIADVVERESGVLDDENGAALFLYSLQLRFGIAFDPAKMVSEEYRGYFDWERYSSAMTADKTAFKRQLMEGVTESIKGKVARINAVISMLSDPTKGRKGLLRQLFAKTVNAARQDYVTAMADVKETIGLRSTAEKDPVQEYKKEAGSIYGEVNADIPVDFLGTLCRLTEFGQFETQLAAAMAVLSAAQPDKSDELLNKVAGLSDRELAELARTLGDEAAAEFAAEEDGRSAIRKLADYRINIRGKTLKVGAIAGASVAGFLQFGVGPVVSQVQTVVARSQAEEQIAKAMESWRKEAEAYQKYTASYTDAQKAFNDAKEKGDAREALKNIDIMLPILEHMNAINPNLPAKNLEQLKEIRAGLITSLFAELNAPAAGEALIAEVPVKEEPAAALAVAPKPAQPQIQPGSVWQSMKRGGAFATRMMLLGLTAAMVPAQQTPQVQPGAEKPAPAATSVTKEETSEERYTRESLNYPDAINSENYDEAFRILSVCIDIAARSAEEGKKGWGEALTELRRRHAGLLELYAANRPDAYRALLVDSYGPLIAKYTTNRGLYIEASDAKKPDKAFDYAEICIANIKELRENGGWKIDPGLDKLITDWERLRTYQLDQKEKAAVAAVAPAAKPAVITVPALIEDLKDKDVAKRHAAVLALGVIGTKEAVLAIVTVSKDKEWIVRAAAAQALGHIGGEEALTILPQLSKDEDAEVRKAAGEAMKQIGQFQPPQKIPAKPAAVVAETTKPTVTKEPEKRPAAPAAETAKPAVTKEPEKKPEVSAAQPAKPGAPAAEKAKPARPAVETAKPAVTKEPEKRPAAPAKVSTVPQTVFDYDKNLYYVPGKNGLYNVCRNQGGKPGRRIAQTVGLKGELYADTGFFEDARSIKELNERLGKPEDNKARYYAIKYSKNARVPDEKKGTTEIYSTDEPGKAVFATGSPDAVKLENGVAVLFPLRMPLTAQVKRAAIKNLDAKLQAGAIDEIFYLRTKRELLRDMVSDLKDLKAMPGPTMAEALNDIFADRKLGSLAIGMPRDVIGDLDAEIKQAEDAAKANDKNLEIEELKQRFIKGEIKFGEYSKRFAELGIARADGAAIKARSAALLKMRQGEEDALKKAEKATFVAEAVKAHDVSVIETRIKSIDNAVRVNDLRGKVLARIKEDGLSEKRARFAILYGIWDREFARYFAFRMEYDRTERFDPTVLAEAERLLGESLKRLNDISAAVMAVDNGTFKVEDLRSVKFAPTSIPAIDAPSADVENLYNITRNVTVDELAEPVDAELKLVVSQLVKEGMGFEPTEERVRLIAHLFNRRFENTVFTKKQKIERIDRLTFVLKESRRVGF
ncbi:MAG: HEAT repeat domain-containing protein, partial [Candidatus Omnitrophica bacterium]|nr:HEAT repeat domain-containing protein [Candidatus Omnitrophota bacterium]